MSCKAFDELAFVYFIPVLYYGAVQHTSCTTELVFRGVITCSIERFKSTDIQIMDSF